MWAWRCILVLKYYECFWWWCFSASSQSLLKFMFIELVMLSNHLILCPFLFCLQSFPALGSLPMSWLFTTSGQSIGASAAVLPVNSQGWFPLGLTDLISLLSKGLSKVFSSTTVQKHKFFGSLSSLLFRIEKGIQQDCLLPPCLFSLYAKHIMWNARLDELQAGSRLRGDISTTSDMWMILLYWQKAKRN